MSVFDEILCKLNEISNSYVRSLNDDIKVAFECLDKIVAEEYQNGRGKRDQSQKKALVNTLMSINEDEDENSAKEVNKEDGTEKRLSNKRSKQQVDGMSSPEQEKRPKRNASVKAQNNITKQVNVNLTQKLRREDSEKSRRRKDDDKENALPLVQVKQEKISLAPEPMETEAALDMPAVKQEPGEDESSMPPPAAPVPSKDPTNATTTGHSPRALKPLVVAFPVKQEKISLPPEPMETEALETPAAAVKQEPGGDESSMPPPAAPVPSKDPTNATTTGRSPGALKPLVVAFPVKQEKISLPPEPMETEAALEVPAVAVKQEPGGDGSSMPPPAAPVPKPRRLPAAEKSTDSEEEAPRRARTAGARGRARARGGGDTGAGADADADADSMPPPAAPAAAERPARASRRATKQSVAGSAPSDPPHQPHQPHQPDQPEPRPKRTRGRKKELESSTTDKENTPLENGIGSPADKPRPKRTRRGKKAENEEPPKPKEPTPEPEIIPKQERISVPDPQSPAIPQKTVKKTKTDTTLSSDDSIQSKKGSKKKVAKSKLQEAISLEETHVITQMNTTVTISMDKTVVLPNGVYDHTDGKNMIAMNETVVLDKINRGTMVIDKPQAKLMDATVVIEKGVATPDLTDDLSLLTDDDGGGEGGEQGEEGRRHQPEPTSAVKAKVQQFEEMAARTTRTKTRAMAKKDAETENSTPPDKMIPKQVLSADTLNKMNSMIFNGKTTQISSSASKPVAKLPPMKTLPASASKAAAISRAREEQSRDDARRKKEAMLEAKKEQQKRKREEKMAAAAAAREAAEKERRAALQAQARDRMEKQAHADQGKIERMKEAERKKQELARKVAETEERRRAEEQARAARLAEEQRRADAARRKQQEEGEAMKKDAALMKEIEKRQKEYLEKQKMKQRMEADKMHTPLKNGVKPPPMEPVYMADGFQYLNSDNDEDETPSRFPTPAWYKDRHRQLALQHRLASALVDGLFSVRVHSVDLRAIFPSVERAVLKRTSSAVWRTPPPPPHPHTHQV